MGGARQGRRERAYWFKYGRDRGRRLAAIQRGPAAQPMFSTSPPRDDYNAFLAAPAEQPDGIALGVKDLFDTAGLVTTYGSAIFRDHVPDETAEAVRRLENAGYAVVGKTNLHEFAYGITSENPHFGDVVNPLDRGRIPGGSSGGSAAALAARLCDVALGTDSAGSIRIPAACCGVVGFKPTHGRVPMDGVFPLAPSFDTAGPMGRSVEDCTALMGALEPGLRPQTLESLEDVHVGLAWLDVAEPLVRERVSAAAELFSRHGSLDFPFPGDVGPAFMREAADVHRELFTEHRELYGANVRTKIERCLRVTDGEVEAAQAARSRYREDCLELMGDFDLLVTPTLAFVAPPAGIGDLALRERVLRLTYPISMLGWPALALPCGSAEAGLPASLQLVGRPGDDALVLAAGAAIERRLR
jgi:aspartyl-tRNA(Asn)/glutamyl-tRNA(Gln) amidotransferase subunit A